MAASEGWSITKTEENDSVLAPGSSSKLPFIKDYFEVVGENERKCCLCSSTVKITKSSNWGMKSHFTNKHSTEPLLKSRKPKARLTVSQASCQAPTIFLLLHIHIVPGSEQWEIKGIQFHL